MHRLASRAPSFKGPFLFLFLAAALVACGDDDRPRTMRDTGVPDTSGGPCTDGELSCLGAQVQECVDGELVPRETCELPQVCAPGVGCGQCMPNEMFCDGAVIRQCNPDGMSSTEVRECPPNEACSAGQCVDACAQAAAERNNMGCDYFAVDLDNEFANVLGGTPPAQEQFAVVLANPSRVAVQAMVFQSVGRPNVPVETLLSNHTVPPQGLVRIDLPNREVDGSTTSVEGPGTMLTNHAYRIRTNFPVVAYQFNPIIESASNDASLLIPVPALDTKYRVLGWPTANPIEIGPDIAGIPDHSYVTVIGTQEGTQLNITLGGAIVAGEIQGGGTVNAGAAGDQFQIVIGPYDVLNLESDGIPGDLSGTIIESSAPVAVFSGGERGIAGGGDLPAHPSGPPDDFCCTEHLEEQVFPTSSWGKNFVITRSPVRSAHATWREPDIYRLIADKDNTVVTTSLPAPFNEFRLSENEWVQFHADRSFIMSSNEAVSIEQILVSQGWVVDWKSGHGGDPSMILYPPFEQYRNNYIFLVPDTFSSNYVVISAPVGAPVRVDGMPVACETETAGDIDGITYETHTCPLAGGTHRVEADVPVGIMVYGYHSVGSYGYAGGANLTRINLI